MPDILAIIFAAMEHTNEVMGEKHWTLFTPETGIMNHDAGEVIDSVDFVGFLMLVEDGIHNATGKNVTLMAPGRVFTLADSPFRTAGTLEKYIEGLL